MSKENVDLDVYCRKILQILIAERKEIGFNQLLKKMKEIIPVSKPTFCDHLKHLEEKKYLIKKVDKNTKSPWKPSFYSANYELINKYIKKIVPKYPKGKLFRVFDMFHKGIDQLNFEQLSVELFHLLFIGDLYIMKIFLEDFKKKEKSNLELKWIKNFFAETLNAIQYKLYCVSNKMTDQEIIREIKKVDDQIEIVMNNFYELK